MASEKIKGAKVILKEICNKCHGMNCTLCQLHEFDRALELYLVENIDPKLAADKAHNEVNTVIAKSAKKYDKYDGTSPIIS